MKSRLAFILLLLAGALTAFASRGKPVIGLSLDTFKEERWQRDRDTFIAEAQKLGATVIVQSANSDDTRQVRDVESLLSRKVDVLVIVPHNGIRKEPSILEKVISVDRENLTSTVVADGFHKASDLE